MTARLILGLHAGDCRIHGVPGAEAPVDHRSRDRNEDRDKGERRKTLTLIGFVERLRGAAFVKHTAFKLCAGFLKLII